MTGVEGYVESAASGMLVGIETAARVKGTFRALLDETIRRIGEE